ncbi:MAG TPA: VOC family protein [Chitinophagaceae bacterium]|nr:VOC family protein [Chitinophagaceae bacterium]
MVKTYGLTHIALAVKDVERSFRFYEQVLGVRATYRQKTFIQFETPGCHDVVVLEESARPSTKTGGILHFGFRLVNPSDIDTAAEAVLMAGGKILDKGEFCPGEPYLFATDPDGYQIEIWYEPEVNNDSYR